MFIECWISIFQSKTFLVAEIISKERSSMFLLASDPWQDDYVWKSNHNRPLWIFVSTAVSTTLCLKKITQPKQKKHSTLTFPSVSWCFETATKCWHFRKILTNSGWRFSGAIGWLGFFHHCLSQRIFNQKIFRKEIINVSVASESWNAEDPWKTTRKTDQPDFLKQRVKPTVVCLTRTTQ